MNKNKKLCPKSQLFFYFVSTGSPRVTFWNGKSSSEEPEEVDTEQQSNNAVDKIDAVDKNDDGNGDEDDASVDVDNGSRLDEEDPTILTNIDLTTFNNVDTWPTLTTPTLAASTEKPRRTPTGGQVTPDMTNGYLFFRMLTG